VKVCSTYLTTHDQRIIVLPSANQQHKPCTRRKETWCKFVTKWPDKEFCPSSYPWFWRSLEYMARKTSEEKCGLIRGSYDVSLKARSNKRFVTEVDTCGGWICGNCVMVTRPAAGHCAHCSWKDRYVGLLAAFVTSRSLMDTLEQLKAPRLPGLFSPSA
jgi:hypothetical protein